MSFFPLKKSCRQKEEKIFNNIQSCFREKKREKRARTIQQYNFNKSFSHFTMKA